MAAPEGNQFWKMRSKHGRDKIFKTPDELWKACCEYFQYIDENPLHSVEQSRGGRTKSDLEVTKDGVKEVDTGLIELPLLRPYTIKGLCIFLNVTSKYLNNFEESLENMEDKELAEDFLQIITRVKDIIYTQKFEGAAAGLFQQNIIARDLGLVDKQSNEHSGKMQPVTLVLTEDNTNNEKK